MLVANARIAGATPLWTVDTRVQNIRMKLGCRSRADAPRRATELGLVGPTS